MKRLTLWVGLALLATSLAASAAEAKKSGSCQQTLSIAPSPRLCADTAALLTSITLPDLKEQCVDLGFEPTDDKDTDGDPSLVLQMGKLKVGLLLYGSLKEEPAQIRSLSLQMRLVMREDASAERANAWNEAARYTRAYAKDKAYLLESDLDIEGGVTWKTISRYMLAFRSAAADFAKHVEFH